MHRDVSWAGFYNARDLGGLPKVGGGTTRHGHFVRCADVQFVTAAGWRAAQDAGFTMVLDLREPDEVYGTGPGSELTAATADPAPPVLPQGMLWRHVPLDDHADRAFWEPFMSDGRWCTPLYYPEFLRMKAARVASVFTALADAPAGIVFHCGGGRDRTGLIAALLLRLAGAEPDAIADDFALSADAVRPLFTRLGRPDQAPGVEAILSAFGTTARRAVLAAVLDLDVRSYLVDIGVKAADVDELRDRLGG
jgi:hypothetical protein